MYQHPRQTKGYTLIELMISILISSFILAGALGVFLALTDHNRVQLQMTKLQHEMRSTMNLMVKDIRRAGYWASANTAVGVPATVNPFMTTGTEITVSSVTQSDTSSLTNACILFTYDYNSDGAIASMGSGTDSDERFGYRLMDGVIQARPPVKSDFSCSNAAGAWEDLTNDSVVTISSLSFSLATESVDVDGSGPGTSVVEVKSITISMAGYLTSDSSVTYSLTETVRLRNDTYKATP